MFYLMSLCSFLMNVILLGVVLPNSALLNVILVNVKISECHSAKYCSAECRSYCQIDECCSSECRDAPVGNVEHVSLPIVAFFKGFLLRTCLPKYWTWT